jgi:hypothetical protein
LSPENHEQDIILLLRSNQNKIGGKWSAGTDNTLPNPMDIHNDRSRGVGKLSKRLQLIFPVRSKWLKMTISAINNGIIVDNSK